MQLSSPDLSDPQRVRGSSLSGNARLDLDNTADLYVGGVPENYKVHLNKLTWDIRIPVNSIQ